MSLTPALLRRVQEEALSTLSVITSKRCTEPGLALRIPMSSAITHYKAKLETAESDKDCQHAADKRPGNRMVLDGSPSAAGG